MKVVVVSQRVDMFSERGETRDAVDQRLIAFLLAAGYMPVPVPNGLYVETSDGLRSNELLIDWLSAVSPRAILLSGGNDIGQCPARDLTEGWLLDHARSQKLPVIGICRGMQMLAHWAGTDLHPVDGHARTRHLLSGEVPTEVNSYHRFGLSGCPTGFDVMARSEDGEIEAIRHRTLPWEGWMWHPEREHPFNPSDVQAVGRLFS